MTVDNSSLVYKSLEDSFAVYGHEEAQATLLYSKAASFLLEGEEGVGKAHCAFGDAARLICQHKPTGGELDRACGSCSSCRALFFFESPNLFFLSLEDRLPFVNFVYRQLLNETSEKIVAKTQAEQVGQTARASDDGGLMRGGIPFSPNLCRLMLLWKREIMRLLSFHRHSRLPLYGASVKPKPGVLPRKPLEIEMILHRVSGWLHRFSQTNSITELRALLLEKNAKRKPSQKLDKQEKTQLQKTQLLRDIEVLQNSLQRNVYLKESLDKMFAWCYKSGVKGVKTVVLDRVDKVQTTAVGSFLKLLEEPPPNLRLFLLTSSKNEMRAEVKTPLLSRLTQLAYKSLNKNEIVNIIAAWSTSLQLEIKNALHTFDKEGSFAFNKSFFQKVEDHNNFAVPDVEGGLKKPFPIHEMIFGVKYGIGNSKGNQHHYGSHASIALFKALEVLQAENFSVLSFFNEIEQLLSLKMKLSIWKDNKQNGVVLPKYLQRRTPQQCEALYYQVEALAKRLSARLVSEKNAFSEWWLFVQPFT